MLINMPKDNCSLNNKSVKNLKRLSPRRHEGHEGHEVLFLRVLRVFVVNKSLYNRLFANIRAMLSPPADEHNRDAVTLFDSKATVAIALGHTA